jgi:glyoxylase-like metal-dependent hydrolase (beta-lactamase superfamily II)
MTDYTMARSMSRSTSGSGGDAAAIHFSKHGLTAPEDIEKIRKRGDYYGSMVPNVPDSFARMMDGQTLRIGSFDWQLIAGFGHAPEHISLYCAAQGVLISGDMLLPRISTNISVWDLEPLADPLKLFLDSLTRYEALPEDTLVLPSHGRPFRGAHTRVRQLRDHHDERLVEVLAACATPQTAADIVPVLFKRALDLHQMTFAMGEALAHLHTLWRRGQVQRVVGGDEVVRFVAG